MTERTCVGRLRHSSDDGANLRRKVAALFRRQNENPLGVCPHFRLPNRLREFGQSSDDRMNLHREVKALFRRRDERASGG